MITKHTKDEELGRVGAHFKGRNILITGGFGFVGSHMTKAMVGFGANVTVLDIRTDPNVASMINDPTLKLRSKVNIVNGDVSKTDIVFEVMKRANYDFIFNFAAAAAVIEKAVEYPYDTIQVNTIGLVNILEAERALRTRPTMIFHASTDKVYGDIDGEPYDEEKTPLCGIGVYDGAKLAADVFAQTYFQVFGVPSVVLRMCNLFGPFDFNTGYRLIPKAMKCLYGMPQPAGPELYFDAIDHWRDYLYIDDCIRAILLIAYNPVSVGQVYNLAAAKFISTPEMLKLVVQSAYEIEREFDHARAETIINNGISIKVRPHHPSVLTIKKQHLNGDKIKRLTGFEPIVEFIDALGRTIRYYRNYFISNGSIQP
jgi:nucleoside-diphosphate-sugar epimerase